MHVYFRQSFLLTLIEDKRQTLPEINVQVRLFGTLEYVTITGESNLNERNGQLIKGSFLKKYSFKIHTLVAHPRYHTKFPVP